jgi:hypothetical protein
VSHFSQDVLAIRLSQQPVMHFGIYGTPSYC